MDRAGLHPESRYLALDHRQPMTVRGDHPHRSRSVGFNEHAAQVVAGFIRTDRENRLVDHPGQHRSRNRQFSLQLLLCRRRILAAALTWHGGKAARIEPHHFEFRAAAFQLDPIAVERRQRDFIAFGLAHDFKKLARVERQAFFLAGTRDLRANPDFEVGGAQSQRISIGFDQNMAEYRNRRAPFHDALDQSQTAKQRSALDGESHELLARLLFLDLRSLKKNSSNSRSCGFVD